MILLYLSNPVYESLDYAVGITDPKGESTIEDNGFGEGPFPIKAKITVTDTEFIADFNGSHPQVKGATNLSFSGLVTGCRSLFKAITTPRMAANGGAFRPMKVLCKPGTIVSAEVPSAVSIYYEVLITSIDFIWLYRFKGYRRVNHRVLHQWFGLEYKRILQVYLFPKYYKKFLIFRSL